MIENFPLLRQPPGSNACLPTCVYAVLLWHGENVTLDNVSAWCQEETQGCFLDIAIDGLRDAGFDLEELPTRTQDDAEEQLRNLFTDSDPIPILVTIQNPLISIDSDHAVVVTDIRRVDTADGEQEIVEYMDPLIGDLAQDSRGDFWDYWFYAGQRAFHSAPLTKRDLRFIFTGK